MQAVARLFPVLMPQIYARAPGASLGLERTGRSAPAVRRAIVLMAVRFVADLGIQGMLSLRLCAILIALQMLGG
jgi:hypothetical protein